MNTAEPNQSQKNPESQCICPDPWESWPSRKLIISLSIVISLMILIFLLPYFLRGTASTIHAWKDVKDAVKR